jgi:hypothetical protein
MGEVRGLTRPCIMERHGPLPRRLLLGSGDPRFNRRLSVFPEEAGMGLPREENAASLLTLPLGDYSVRHFAELIASHPFFCKGAASLCGAVSLRE